MTVPKPILAPLGTILTVDDAPANIHILASLLTAKGYQVRMALNGESALLSITASLPDLVLLDVNMPGLSGYEVCERLKSQAETRDIPIIFISALDETMDKVRAFQTGGADYITKPFQSEEVLARIETHLTLYHQSQELKAKKASLEKQIRQRLQIQRIAQSAQHKTEQLLHNILPLAAIRELKESGSVAPRQCQKATFLFTDIVNFTYRTAAMPPGVVVQMLNQVFSSFDRQIEHHGVEKIRTIGDAYFVAGGVPETKSDHVNAIAALALDLQQTIRKYHWPDGDALQLRIGIHTGGPVVACVTGVKRFAYDIWGDTVHLASQMEVQGQPGKIQVSLAVQQCLQGYYHFQRRGSIAIQNLGQVETFWLMEGCSK